MQNPRAMPAFVSVPHRYWRHVARAKPAPLIILWWAGRIGNALSREERVRSYIKDNHGSVWCALALMMWPCSSYPLFMISSTSLPHPFPRLQSAHQLSSKRRREKVVRCLCWRQLVRRQNLYWARAYALANNQRAGDLGCILIVSIVCCHTVCPLSRSFLDLANRCYYVDVVTPRQQ